MSKSLDREIMGLGLHALAIVINDYRPFQLMISSTDSACLITRWLMGTYNNPVNSLSMIWFIGAVNAFGITVNHLWRTDERSYRHSLVKSD